MMQTQAWVSFCMSTFKRPEILRQQLDLLSKQTFSGFEVIISDNDPSSSAKEIVESFHDSRFRYFNNEENLGMIKSFNKSIERASTEFIVMVTDDDPVHPEFLTVFNNLYKQYPSFSIYCGFQRKGKKDDTIEVVSKDDFLIEVLDPAKTSNLLWSSAIIRKKDAIGVGMIPDYDSPHLADHAFMALVGSVNGGIILNRMFSSLSSHDSNFSKFNFHYYVKGCEGFYMSLLFYLKDHRKLRQYKRIIKKHLGNWFIVNIFSLKKYYTVIKKDGVMLKNIKECASAIMRFTFMKRYWLRFNLKNMIFLIKKVLRLLK